MKNISTGSPSNPTRSDEGVGKSGVGWRVGRKVPINVYDENDAPVCQCQTAGHALMIVAAVNQAFPRGKSPVQIRDGQTDDAKGSTGLPEVQR